MVGSEDDATSGAVLGHVAFVERQFRLEPFLGDLPLRIFVGVRIAVGNEQLV